MIATTIEFDSSVDLNNVAGNDGYLFVRSGVGYAARGIATRIAFSGVQKTLSAIQHHNLTNLDVAPIAMGVLPFVASSPCDFFIPKQVVGKDEKGNCWLTTIDDESVNLEISQPLAATTNTFTVRPLTPIENYLQAVASARDAVRDGRITKAVIAREILVEAAQPIDVHAVLQRLRSSFGNSYRYSMNGFIGASPELLIEVSGQTIRSHPLAGTTPRTGDPITDNELARKLISSMKDQVEHRVVIDVIHDMLLPYCSYLDWEPEPSVIQVANVQHLGTLIEGHLSDDHPPLLELARMLCPTPALGGHPRAEALEVINQLEGFDRKNYGGAVGWVDARGNGIMAVAIRCAELSDDRKTARLIAGGGIVAASDPNSELAETQAKFQAMLSAIVRP
ncbi:MAG: isochorismate synthase [Actinomycetes bacterium]